MLAKRSRRARKKRERIWEKRERLVKMISKIMWMIIRISNWIRVKMKTQLLRRSLRII